MAFDQRLEADYVDLNFGTILAHTPILGSLWSLLRGGSRNDDHHHHCLDETKEEYDNDSPSCGAGLSRDTLGIPDLASSSLSVRDTSLSSISELNTSDINAGASIHTQQQQLFRRSKRSKKALSWSDMSGQGNLCEYFDYEEKRHGDSNDEEKKSSADGVPAAEAQLPPPPSEAATIPKMTRSRSIGKQLISDGNSYPYSTTGNSYEIKNRPQEQQRHSYLPRMDPQKPGIVMPSMHRSSAPHPSEQHHQGESPQYGFYVNLTPPSPELYISSTSKHHKRLSSHSVASTASTSSNGASPPNNRPIVAKPVNPIFQGLLLQQQQRNNCNRNVATASNIPINFPSAPL